jgi:hypothetical protein
MPAVVVGIFFCGLLLNLSFVFLLANQPSVVIDEFLNKQECIDSSNAVGDDVGNEFALGTGFLGKKQLMPEITNLLATLLNLSIQLAFP